MFTLQNQKFVVGLHFPPVPSAFFSPPVLSRDKNFKNTELDRWVQLVSFCEWGSLNGEGVFQRKITSQSQASVQESTEAQYMLNFKLTHA